VPVRAGDGYADEAAAGWPKLPGREAAARGAINLYLHKEETAMRRRDVVVMALTAGLTACAVQAPDTDTMTPGSDRDAHGCIPSAGYAWCARTQQCERPWELAEAEGFPVDQEAFDRHCGNDSADADSPH
jgi:hypothetical protein